MTELSSVLNFLENSGKGKLDYDRDWAKSAESVHRVLNELSLGIQEINIDKFGDKNRKYHRAHEIKVVSNNVKGDNNDNIAQIKDEITDEIINEDNEVLSLTKGLNSNSFLPIKDDDDLPAKVNNSLGRFMYKSPVDELLQCRDDDLAERSYDSSSSTDDSIDGCSNTDYRHQQIDVSRVVKTVDLTDALINTNVPNQRYFGIAPVHVSVNRTLELSLDTSQQIQQYQSPRFISVIEQSYQRQDNQKEERSVLLEENVISVNSEVQNTSIFDYQEGFISRVSNTPLCSDVVNLRLENIKQLLDIGNIETENDNVDNNVVQSNEDSHEEDFTESKLDAELSKNREKIRSELEKERADMVRRSEANSARLAEQAQRRYLEEMEEYRRDQQLLLEKVVADAERVKEDIVNEMNMNLAADLQRREETRQLLDTCKQQEDQIRKEMETENEIRVQGAKFEKLMPSLKKSIVTLLELWSSIEDKTLFCQASTETAGNIHTEFSSTIDSIKAKISKGCADDQDWENVSNLEAKINRGVNIIQEDIQRIQQEEANARKREEEKVAEAEAEEASKQNQQQEAQPLAAQTLLDQSSAAESTAAQPSAAQPLAAQASVALSYSSEQFYRDTLSFKAKYVEDVVFTDQEKKMKSELTLGISTALNAISAQTREHLNDKLAKLTLLLAGKPVTMKDIQICAGQHKFGVKYCTALLAKKIVRQGEDVVSSKAEAAFPIAAVALALWDKFPDFGQLLQAYFFEFCPMLAPFYPQKLQAQTDKEYYTSLGYKYEKEVMEPPDKYLKRMTGLACLYSAITVVAKPQGTSAFHPMGPNFIWRYFATVISQPPLPDITATLLFVILETTGQLMATKYEGQFFKLLSVIKSVFLPALEAVKTDGGPTSRLDMFLTKALQNNSVDKPKGSLAPGFIKNVVM